MRHRDRITVATVGFGLAAKGRAKGIRKVHSLSTARSSGNASMPTMSMTAFCCRLPIE